MTWWHLAASAAASVMHKSTVPIGLPLMGRCSLGSRERLLSSSWQAVLRSLSGHKV